MTQKEQHSRKRAHYLNIAIACVLTGLFIFSAWTLGVISFTTGETSSPLYAAAWFGQMSLLFQAWSAWYKIVIGERHG